MWSPGRDELPEPEVRGKWLQDMPKYEASVVKLCGVALHKQFRKSASSVGGADHLVSGALACLPVEACDALAALWNAILNGFALPAQRAHVRVAWTRKNASEDGQISVASAAWRAGAFVIARTLRRW